MTSAPCAGSGTAPHRVRLRPQADGREYRASFRSYPAHSGLVAG